VTGAPLLGLLDRADRALAELGGERDLDRFALMAEHRDHRVGAQLARQIHRIADQGPAQQRMQHLHARRAHAGALAGGKDDTGQVPVGVACTHCVRG
jgi:hypothetical protein